MFWKNFITLLRRYTASSLLNIIGMSVAFASVYLLMVQVTNDLSYNKKIPDADLIYRLEYPSWSKEGYWGSIWNRILPQQMCDAVPEVAARGAIFLGGNDVNLSFKDNNEIRNIKLNASQSDREGLDVFNFDLIAGSVENFEDESVIITEKIAKRYGLEVGDILHKGHGAKDDNVYNIVAIYRDFPKPSYLANIDCFVGLPPIIVEEELFSWSYNCYLRLHSDADPEDVATKMREHFRESLAKEGLSEEEVEEELSMMYPRLNPLTRLYFADDCDMDVNAKGDITTTYTLLLIAILILAIAFINFVNFFFALIPVRIRTVNNLKIFGAPTIRLRLNFLFETLGLITLSILGAAIIVVAFADSPLINYISTSVRVVDNWRLILSLIAVLFVLGLLVSIYPAWYITRFSPAMVMKGSFHATKSGRMLRYMLVGIQYVISLTLIIVAIFLHRQHHFMTNHDMGFDKEQLFFINTNVKTLESYYTIADMLKQNPIVEDVTYSDHFFVSMLHGGWNINMNDKQTKVGAVSVAHNFLDFMGIKLVEGRNFSSSDSIAVIMNETGRNQLELKLDDVHTYSNFMQKIVGFSEDYESSPLQYEKEPLCFMVNKDDTIINCVYIRISQGVSMKEARDYILDTFMNLDSTVGKNELDEQLHYVDHFLEYYYQSERKLSILITIFTCISILISLMGVFGLVLFETQYRRREIAIRRVNGATVKDILKMFNVQFLKVVAVCSVIAIPLSYYIVDKYLMSFANRIALSAWIFVLSVVIILLLTIFVVTTRSWKAANENPIDAIN